MPRFPDPEGAAPGLPRNFLRPCLLLLLREDTCHGYQLIERLAAFGLAHQDAGGLYRTLRAMEREGLVASSWERSGSGPPRRTYSITPEGEDWLHAWAGALRSTRSSLEDFLDRYETIYEGIDAREP